MIQLIVTITSFISSIVLFKTINFQKNILENRVDIYNTIHLNVYNTSPSKTYVENFVKLQDYIASLTEVSDSGAYDFINVIFKELRNNSQFLNLRKDLSKGTIEEQFPYSIDILRIDKGLLRLAKLDTLDTNTDNLNDSIPLLVGSAYKEIIHIGETLTLDDDSVSKYKVIGYLDKNSDWIDDQGYASHLLVNLDDKFVVLSTNKDNQTVNYIRAKSSVFFYTMKDANKLADIMNKIDTKANDLGIKTQSKTILQEIQDHKDQMKDTFFYMLFLSIFLAIFSTIGIAATMLSSIIDRKREFGIRIMNGGSISHIKYLVLGEILTMMCISTSLAIIGKIVQSVKYMKSLKTMGLQVNPLTLVTWDVVISAIIFVMVLTLASIVIPLKKTSKLQPKDLIGGID
jgi:putative ABC transport system permease protein